MTRLEASGVVGMMADAEAGRERVVNRTSESDKRVLSVWRRSQDCHSGWKANLDVIESQIPIG
jgi:hypothetical protein